MKELFNALKNTLDLVQFNINAAGIELTLYSKILDYSEYEDGINLFLENESELFVSFACKLVSSESDGDCTEYNILTLDKAIISIIIAD